MVAAVGLAYRQTTAQWNVDMSIILTASAKSTCVVSCNVSHSMIAQLNTASQLIN